MTFKNLVVPFLMCTFLAACAQPGPKISLSADRIQHKGWIVMRGEGFTPNSNVVSHLRRPDGSEFPVIIMLTDEGGKFTHEVDTLLLVPGTHELWVEDSATKATSNTAKFVVSLEPVTATR